MAPRPQKRTLQPGDFKTPEKALEALNPTVEGFAKAMDEGVSLANLTHSMVRVTVDVPDDWTAFGPYSASEGGARYGAGWGAKSLQVVTPGYRYVSQSEVQLRGDIANPSATGTQSILRGLPPAAWRQRHLVDGGAGAIRLDTLADGTLNGAATFVALDSIRYEASTPRPYWATPAKAPIRYGEDDWGAPAIALVVGVERQDEDEAKRPTSCNPLPVWTTEVRQGDTTDKISRRYLVLRYVEGLRPGRQTVTCLLLYP